MAPRGKGEGEVGKGRKCVGLDVNETYNTLPFMCFVEPYRSQHSETEAQNS